MIMKSTKNSRFDTFKRADLGTVFAIGALITAAVKPQYGWSPVAATALYMLSFLSRRPRDEYALRCWYAGTHWAFVALMLAVMVLPFLGGMFIGLTDGHMGTPAPGAPPLPSPYEVTIDRILDRVPELSILTFFAGFQWQRFKGDV